jgi:CheY-like chemotaxis protein
MASDPFSILLVEDNAADVYLFRKALLGAGIDFELTVIGDGSMAIAFVRGEGEYAGAPVPDLAVIDLNLPKKDGIEVLEAVRAVGRFDDMPVVVVSSSASPSSRLKEKHLRVARYITKPPDLDSFLQIGAPLKEILMRTEARRAGD